MNKTFFDMNSGNTLKNLYWDYWDFNPYQYPSAQNSIKEWPKYLTLPKHYATMVEQADTSDLKSDGPKAREGSIPSGGNTLGGLTWYFNK